jgi:predicted transcriptional regulator
MIDLEIYYIVNLFVDIKTGGNFMQTKTVRVSYATWKTLQEMAAKFDNSMQVILDKAIEEYRRKSFLKEANKAFAALQNDSEAWKNELEERAAWDTVLFDGLKEE